MSINVKTAKDWSIEDIERFWTWLSTTQRKEQDYFAYSVGDAIHNLLDKQTKVKGNYLDYGCGLGHLFPHMFESNINGYGLEFSKSSVEEVNKRFKDHPKFKGVQEEKSLPSAYENDFFDVVSLIETIEHLNDHYLPITLKELYRVLKPGGKLLVTTPFDETLSSNHIYCPFCNSEFHRMQHMRSFSIESMTHLLEENKFKIEYCNNVNLYSYSKSIKTRFTSSLKNQVKSRLNKKTDANYKLKPHLIAIVTK